MIRLATKEDLNEICDLFASIKKELATENNPQWGASIEQYPYLNEYFIDYPNRQIIEEDINNKELYVYEEDKIIKGIITICKDNGEYEGIVETSNKKSIIIHRLAIPENYRKLGLAQKLISYAENKAKEDKISIIKADTEVSNIKMNNLFNKLGFKVKGNFSYDDYPGKYIYYEKEI